MDKKKFEDMRKALEDRGYEVIRSIGKGAFGEVLLSRKSNPTSTQKTLIKCMQSKSSPRLKSRRNPSYKNTSNRKSIS